MLLATCFLSLVSAQSPDVLSEGVLLDSEWIKQWVEVKGYTIKQNKTKQN